MINSSPINYKGIQYPSAYIEMGGTIGHIRISVKSLINALEKDGLYDAGPPLGVTAIDDQIAYYLEDVEFQFPVKKVKDIVRSAYDEEENTTVFVQKTIRELKQGEFFRLKKSATAPVWVRGKYIPELKKYSTYKFDNISHEHHLKGSMQVYVGFAF